MKKIKKSIFRILIHLCYSLFFCILIEWLLFGGGKGLEGDDLFPRILLNIIFFIYLILSYKLQINENADDYLQAWFTKKGLPRIIPLSIQKGRKVDCVDDFFFFGKMIIKGFTQFFGLFLTKKKD